MNTQHDVSKAREILSNILVDDKKPFIWLGVEEMLAQALSDARKEENEACAKVAERFQREYEGVPVDQCLLQEAIRLRTQEGKGGA